MGGVFGLRSGLLASSAVTALLALAGAAEAGGFAVREQSAEFQGMSFAGNAASGGGLSGMFWNPAVAAYAPAGIYTESHFSGIFGHVSMMGDTTNVLGNSVGLPQNSGNIANPAVVPSSYMSYRLNDRWVAALSINAPLGLSTEPANRTWSGQTFARTSEIKTMNFTPTLAYKLMPTVSIGVGLQIEHMDGRLKSASGLTGPLADQNTIIKGSDTSIGFTAGVNWTPSEHTAIGLGYRSSINHDLKGTISAPSFIPGIGFTTLGASIQAPLNTPDTVTLSLRHELTERFSILATGEWSHWSRVDKLDIVCQGNGSPPAPTLCPTGGRIITSLPLGWHDGWMVALGGEYKATDQLKLRTGVAYEASPIQNATERTQRTPDVDRIWASAGATYKWSEKVAFDLGYSHIFGIGNGDIDRTSGTPGTPTFLHYVGKVDSSADIVSASLKVKLGDMPAESLK